MDYTCIYFIWYSDLDECANDSLNDCHDNATCSDTEGSYTCMCKDGYTGDGNVCAGDVKIWIVWVPLLTTIFAWI